MYILYSVGEKHNWLEGHMVFKTRSGAHKEQGRLLRKSIEDFGGEDGYLDDPNTTDYRIVEVTQELLERLLSEANDLKSTLNEFSEV